MSLFFFSSRRRHTRSKRDWSSDVCSSDLVVVRWRLVAIVGKSLVAASWIEVLVFGFRRGRPLASREDLHVLASRSEERRVGKECRPRWSPYQLKQRTSYHAVHELTVYKLN